MRGRALACLAAVAAAATAGCGTSLNLDGDSRIYGGVVGDFETARERLVQAADPNWRGMPGASPTWNLTLTALAVADVPLSLVGDTLTLPFTIPTALERNDVGPGPESLAEKAAAGAAERPRGGTVPMGW